MTNIRNILLFGRTGNGKSTLGNVLVNKNNNFEEVFEESSRGVSQTRKFETAEFMIGDVKYQVIDTVGIGDTSLPEKEVLYKIGEAAYKVRDGLNQILFVTCDRFTKEEIKAYNLSRDVVFDADVLKYTTIVRTKFENFMDSDECRKDELSMRRENSELSSVINSCNKVIHVNNPPLNISNKRRLEVNREDRELSRSKLFLHLGSCQVNYKPKNLDGLNARIGNHMTEIEKLQNQLKNMQNLNEGQRRQMQNEIDRLRGEVSKETRGWFQKAGALIGEAVDNTIEAVGNTLYAAVEVVEDNCRII